MRYVIWEQDGGAPLRLDGNGPYFLTELTSSLSATPETSRAPRQHGVTTWHTALDAPTVNLTGGMWIAGDKNHPALAEFDRARRELAQTFAPHRWGTLTYGREDGPLRLRCRPVATPAIDAPPGTVGYASIDVTFTADTPFWESAAELVEAVGMTRRFWHFPWAPVKTPMGAYDRYARIWNPTGETIYPLAEIYTTAQHVTLANQTTGQHVTIEHAIASGQKLVVDLRDVTAFLYEDEAITQYGAPAGTQRSGSGGEKEGQRSGVCEDVSNWMSLDSDPWGLEPGENVVVISSDAVADTPVTFLKYRLLYLGV